MTERPPRLAVASRTVTAALAAAALAACTSLVPEHRRPVAPLPAAYPGVDPADPATPASDIDWRDFFGDERLKQLIALALQNNRDLRLATLAIEQARAQLQVRRADEQPTVNAGIAANRQPTASGGIASLYTAGLSVTAYELDLFGRVRSLSQAALQQFYVTEEARKAVQIALVGAVANAHVALQADAALTALAEQTLVTREEALRLIRLRFEHGAASELELRQAESLLEGATVALAQAERQRALDANALALLVGQPLPADLPDPLSLDDPRIARDVPPGLPSALLERRPDVRQAERALKAAEANIGAARAAFFPRITLTGSVGFASGELANLFGSGGAWSFAPQLLAPIFDSGRNRAALDATKVGREIAVAQYEKAVQTAFREVADALAGRATLAEQLRAQRAQAEAEAARARIAELRHRGGVASALDVLDAQRALFAARQAVLQAQALRVQNQVALYKALGGGWKEPDGTR